MDTELRMEQKILAGKIINTHGIKGEVKIASYLDSPELFCTLDRIYIDDKPYVFAKAYVHKGSVIAFLPGVDDMNTAETFKNKQIYMDKDAIKLPAGVYYVSDLLGVAVHNADTNECYGAIVDVIATGANDVYVVGDRQLLIPAIKDVIISVDMEKRLMTIRPLEGLIE